MNIYINSLSHYHPYNGGYDKATEEDVQGIMDTWLALSTELLPISEACNDKSKQDDTKNGTLKKHVAAYLKLWFPYIDTKNPIYHKLHSLMCGFIYFMGVMVY